MPLELSELARKYFEEIKPEERNGDSCSLCKNPISKNDLTLRAIRNGNHGITKGEIYGFVCCASWRLLPHQPEADYKERETHL